MNINTWEKEFQYPNGFEYRIDKLLSLLNINQIDSIMDLGCGKQTLKEKLYAHTKYIGVDIHPHVETSIIKDFNKGEFHNEQVDIIFCAGIFEYIYDLENLIYNISNNTNVVVLSYNFLEDNIGRNKIWVNKYTRDELFFLFRKYGFTNIIIESNLKYTNNILHVNNESIAIISKPQYKINLINFSKIVETKNNENTFFIQKEIEKLDYKIDKIINTMAWWIPIKSMRDKFRDKFVTEQNRTEQNRTEQNRTEQNRTE